MNRQVQRCSPCGLQNHKFGLSHWCVEIVQGMTRSRRCNDLLRTMLLGWLDSWRWEKSSNITTGRHGYLNDSASERWIVFSPFSKIRFIGTSGPLSWWPRESPLDGTTTGRWGRTVQQWLPSGSNYDRLSLSSATVGDWRRFEQMYEVYQLTKTVFDKHRFIIKLKQI